MLKNKNIIIFSSDDWNSGLKSSKYHIACGFARQNRVLFVNSIGLRNPTVNSKDLSRIFQKLASFIKGVSRVQDNLYVFTPVVIPFHGSRLVRAINKILFIVYLWTIQKRLGLSDPVYIVFSPTVYPLIERMCSASLVYYCIDELSGYRDVDKAKFLADENRLMKKADSVICCSQKLVDLKKSFSKNVYYVPHGVDWAHFRRTVDEDFTRPDDLKGIASPIIGFFGFISEDWIDFEIINSMARQHPEWSMVLIGRSKLDLNGVCSGPNIHFLGIKSFDELPRYSKFFDVALIPFKINELTISCNPLKLFEYLASGLPVVSVDIPEVSRFGSLVDIAHTPDDFIANVERSLRDNNTEKQLLRSDSVKAQTWSNRLDKISDIIIKHSRDMKRKD